MGEQDEVNLKEIQAAVRLSLPKSRYLHTLGVIETAQALAVAHPVAQRKVFVASLLHDCAKGLSYQQLKKALKKSGADKEEEKVAALWHAPVGAWIAKRRYGCKDPEILSAVRYHSTGAPGMNLVAKILFVADYIEPGRKWAGLKRLRVLAFKSLDDGLKEVVASKIEHLLKTRKSIHPNSILLWNQLVRAVE